MNSFRKLGRFFTFYFDLKVEVKIFKKNMTGMKNACPKSERCVRSNA